FRIDGALFRRLHGPQAEGSAPAGAAAEPAEAGAGAGPARAPAPRGGLNPAFRLDNFVAGPGNRLAHGAALAVAERPGDLYNPLFVYGGCGLGKSHLLQGIARALEARTPSMRVLYVSCELFVNQFLAALQRKGMAEFRERYRHYDVLVLDDVHLLAGKEHTQEEFLHTFNSMSGARRQIVLASDSHPREIERLRQSLVSRFVSGLVAEIQPPDLATRRAILDRKCAEGRGAVPPEVLDVIAREVPGNVRELEGALIRIAAHARLLGEPPTPALAARLLAECGLVARRATCSEIAARVAAGFGVGVTEIESRSRTRRVALARHVAIYLARVLRGQSFSEAGAHFGGLSHATALAADRRIRERLVSDPELRRRVDEVADGLRGGAR
ncbi:MAG: chromosomal replication initiator protein DnaA, partial [Planctomycetales bacterium]|nr:chromosomal replication initiator protein DnaA [Planctomycetales bacterium]